KDLPQASSLCGACYEACPVKINIPLHLINMRRDIVNSQLNGFWERVVYRLWAWGMKSPVLYGVISWMQKMDLRRRAKGTGWVEEKKMHVGGVRVEELVGKVGSICVLRGVRGLRFPNRRFWND